MRDRRRKREVHMADLPEPEMRLNDSSDWQPLLDRELDGLPKKYRNVLVLCDLEGRSRKEAARQLGLKEGTLSSRLATARRMLATRLSKYGLTVSGGALAASLAQSTASAKVPVSLVWTTAKAAALVAAGQYVGVSVPAIGLMKGAMKTMFLAKLKTVIGTSFIAVALGVGGLIYNAELVPGGARAADEAKPKSELEMLRRENELLKMNLRVTLEKIIAQEEELKKLKGKAVAENERIKSPNARVEGLILSTLGDKIILDPKDTIRLETTFVDEAALRPLLVEHLLATPHPDVIADVEAAIKAWKDGKDKASRDKALVELELLIANIKAGQQKEKPPAGKLPPVGR
jgi:predicted DNA-binding protein (UPF0251 family)